jgi:hypothetical protein
VRERLSRLSKLKSDGGRLREVVGELSTSAGLFEGSDLDMVCVRAGLRADLS